MSITTLLTNFDAQVTFVSGITSAAKVASTTFWTWRGNNPATFSGVSDSMKWGSTTLSTQGTAGGNVTYWFDTASNWTAAERTALISGLGLWSSVANITFSMASSAASANFQFLRGQDGSAYEAAPNSTSVAVGSSTDGSVGSGAYISIDTSTAGFGPIGASLSLYGGYPYQTLVHEIGHLLGLGHGGAYNGNVTSSTQQFSAYDSRLWTLMSYIDPWDTSAKYYSSYSVTGTDWGISPDGYRYEPITPMILDILAAQRIYGVATSGPLASGGQVFGFHSNIGGTIGQYFDFTIDTHPVVTIWDGGLNNTLDLSGFSAPSTISLEQGTFSSANGATNNIGIAAGTVIETAIGGSGNDAITGNSSNNVIDGGQGADRMTGGVGNDTYLVDNSGDVVIELAGEGGDQIWAFVNYALPDNVERLELRGAAHDGSGNAVANTLLGSSGADVLNGNGGADLMIGGAGDDLYFVDDAGDVIVEAAGDGSDQVWSYISYTLPDNIERLDLFGNAPNGTGNGAENILTGNAAANILNGGAGADLMLGGGGDDTYFVDNAGDLVQEVAGGGNDQILAFVNFTLPDNVERLQFYGNAYFGGGNAASNTILGTSHADVIDGGAGADVMQGGAGDDSYFVDNAGDMVLESPGEGNDQILSFVDATLPANVERLELLVAAVNGSGNSAANTIIGNDGGNVLNGNGGADLMIGRGGNDVYIADDAGDVVLESVGGGYDQIWSFVDFTLTDNVEGLTLLGSALNGAGNAGDNTIIGNARNNILSGNGGTDNFVFHTGFGRDTITDFTAGTAADDLIQYGDNLFANFADVMAHAAQAGADVLITHDAANVLTLSNAALANLHANDFLFA